jgi:tetratricopeptide (TPR) repeat protein
MRLCAHCFFDNPAGAVRCVSCGALLGLPAGEWHPATVVWASASAPPSAEAEAVFERLEGRLPPLAVLVDDQQGYLIRRPAGLTVVFGAQVAREDDAVRAVRMAQALQRALSEPGPDGGAWLVARVGVSGGAVVAGYVGSPAQPEFVVTGEPLLAAQQVAEAAAPGAVWVTTPVRNATNHQFVYAPLPAPAGGLEVWALEAERERPGPARGLPGLRLPLIGRETPLEAMLALAQLTLPAGRGAVLWVEGEAGIGKTRLLREFADKADALGAPVWAGQCPPAGSACDLGLFIDLFRRRLGLPPGAAPEAVAAALEAAGWPADGTAWGSAVQALLATPEPTVDPAALRDLFAALASPPHGLVLLLDDLHWIDPASSDLLLHISNLIASTPLLLVCALRWDEAESSDDRVIKVHSLMRPEQVLRLHLDRLSDAEAERLLSELLADDDLPADLRDFVLKRSEGNPFYIEEMVRTLIEQDYLHRRAGRWQIDLSVNLQELPLPASLGALIQSRVDRLAPEPKVLLQCAAVIGGVFEEGLLALVSEQPGVSAALTRLEARGLLRRTARVHLWQFTHTLIETAVYATLLPAQRQALHQRVAEALEARWQGTAPAHAAELAYHFAQANAGQRALRYLTLAAEEAAGRQAYEEALAYFQQAAVLLPPVPSPHASDSLRWRIAVGLGDAYRDLGEYTASQTALEDGLLLLARPELTAVQHAGLYRRLGETAQHSGALENSLRFFALALEVLGGVSGPEAAAEAARTLAGRALTFVRQGELELARQAGEASALHARRAGSLGELAAAENMLGVIYYQQRNWEQAAAHTRQAMRLREQMGQTRARLERGLAGAGAWRPLDQPVGDWAEVGALYERALALRREIGDQENVLRLQRQREALAHEQQRFEHAPEADGADGSQLGYHSANAHLNLAGALLIQGRLDAASEHAATALRPVEALGAHDLLSEYYRIQAALGLARQEWAPARAAATRAAALGAEAGDRSLEAAAWRMLAEIELEQGLVPQARAAMDKAWEASRGLISAFEVGRLAAQAGRLSAYMGDLETARGHFASAREVFAGLGAEFEMQSVNEAERGLRD